VARDKAVVEVAQEAVSTASGRRVIRARGSELARRGEKSTGGFDEFMRSFPHQHADFTLAA